MVIHNCRDMWNHKSANALGDPRPKFRRVSSANFSEYVRETWVFQRLTARWPGQRCGWGRSEKVLDLQQMCFPQALSIPVSMPSLFLSCWESRTCPLWPRPCRSPGHLAVNERCVFLQRILHNLQETSRQIFRGNPNAQALNCLWNLKVRTYPNLNAARLWVWDAPCGKIEMCWQYIVYWALLCFWLIFQESLLSVVYTPGRSFKLFSSERILKEACLQVVHICVYVYMCVHACICIWMRMCVYDIDWHVEALLLRFSICA